MGLVNRGQTTIFTHAYHDRHGPLRKIVVCPQFLRTPDLVLSVDLLGVGLGVDASLESDALRGRVGAVLANGDVAHDRGVDEGPFILNHPLLEDHVDRVGPREDQ